MTAPTAPRITSIQPGDQTLTVSFLDPEGDGGSPLANYQYSVDNGGTYTTRNPASVTSPLVVSGLTNGTTYNVRIRAINQLFNTLGAGAPSNVVSATPSAVVSGALLWLKCDSGVTLSGGVVTSWADQSGNGLNFGQKPNAAYPLQHTDSSILFTASTMYNDPNARVLQNTSSGLQQTGLYTLFCVVRAGGPNACVISKSTDATKRRRYQISINGGGIFVGEGNGDVFAVYNTGTGNDVNIKRLIVSQTPASNQIVIRYNGSQVNVYTAEAVSATTTNTAPVYLGASPFSPGSTYNAEASNQMYVYEILLYQSVLTLAQIQQMENYLNGRWSVY